MTHDRNLYGFGMVPPSLLAAAEKARAEGRLAWRCTDAHGRPMNGGAADPLVVGRWSESVEPEACYTGWHMTTLPHKWRGARVWLVEGGGACGGTKGDKTRWEKIRPLAEVDPQLCMSASAGVRAGLRDLPGANLAGASLTGAYLFGANLARANLAGAYLFGANLFGANLFGANLFGASLGRADLARADLRKADLRKADLRGADLARADLRKARLLEADLARADLRLANITGTNLTGADLSRADLSGACRESNPPAGWKITNNRLERA